MVDYSHGNSKEYFGHADYKHGLGQGKTAQELLDFINKNMKILSPGDYNQPGGGGLYDEMVEAARKEKLIEDKFKDQDERMAAMFKARPPVPIYEAPKYQAPAIPDPKTLTTKGSAVGGGAKGVKIKRSKASKGNKNTRGTRSLSRSQRNSSMKISNLNIT